MVMCGLRFFAEVFPDQIPTLCREGLADEHATDALIPLAHLWATRNPGALAPALPEFQAREKTGTLDDRLDAWVVDELFRLFTGERPRGFQLPTKEPDPEIAFPGDTQLFETEVEMNGLVRHNTFARMANERLRRAGMVLGSMDRAFRYLVLKVRESKEPAPRFHLDPAKKLAFAENSPRPRQQMEQVITDAILHQCAGEEWPPARAALVRLAMGYGMDPWIASATPNPWPDMDAWPSDSDVERWTDAGSLTNADVALKIRDLLEGVDLTTEQLLLGAVLRIPTYRRDLEFRFWLTTPGVGKFDSSTPSSKTLAGWLGGWSAFAAQSARAVSVQFCGTLVNYPNSELEITPTERWTSEWQWHSDPKNALRFQTQDGSVAAWYERWLGSRSHSRHTHRQPLLSRWVAVRECFPSKFDELREWTRRTNMLSGLLSRPE